MNAVSAYCMHWMHFKTSTNFNVTKSVLPSCLSPCLLKKRNIPRAPVGRVGAQHDGVPACEPMVLVQLCIELGRKLRDEIGDQLRPPPAESIIISFSIERTALALWQHRKDLPVSQVREGRAHNLLHPTLYDLTAP